jgi:magnesium transporter
MSEPISADSRPLSTSVAHGDSRRSPVVNCVAYASSGKRMYDTTLDEISDVLAQPDTFMCSGCMSLTKRCC